MRNFAFWLLSLCYQECFPFPSPLILPSLPVLIKAVSYFQLSIFAYFKNESNQFVKRQHILSLCNKSVLTF
jgi:hypothetical protein